MKHVILDQCKLTNGIIHVIFINQSEERVGNK
jgi:hypothetical protein